MNISDIIDESKFSEFEFHKELNPRLWNEGDLKPNIRKALLKIAKVFIKFLKVKSVVEDIVITGSSANYNYSKNFSDLDLHVVLDFSKIDKNMDIVKELMLAKKGIWNENHIIKIKGINVELYAQDVSEKHVASGVFSILKNKWIRKPSSSHPKIDIHSAEKKAKVFENLIDKSVKDKRGIKSLDAIMDRIKAFRQSGLDKSGEYSVENLAFKILRRNGSLEKLSNTRKKELDKELSIKENIQNSHTKEDFIKIGQLQRDLPESAMLQIQLRNGGGVLNPVVEHAGDLLHRANESPTFDEAGYDYVKNKVGLIWKYLSNPYGFEIEMEENIRNNAQYRGEDVKKLRYDVNDKLKKYAEAFSVLPVFNDAQKLMQKLCVDIGDRSWDDVRSDVEEIKSHLGSKESWKAFAHEGLSL